MQVKFKKLREDAVVPRYMTAGAAGLDLVACEGALIWHHDITAIGTGLAIELPDGVEAQVRPRSSLAKVGVTVVNSPGTIDCDFRGEIKVLLTNHSRGGYSVHPGDRIAQLVIVPVVRAELVEVDRLSDTDRGDGGFGSTGRG